MKAIEKPQLIINTTLLILLALIALILTLSGCSSERIQGNRDLMTEERTAQPFSRVIAQGNITVHVIPSADTRILVKAESNILPYLYALSDGNTITVGFKNGFNIQEHFPVEVTLYTPEMESLKLSGSGDIDCIGFETTEVELQITGSGNINAGFTSTDLTATVSGSGNMNISGSSPLTHFAVSGSGNIRADELAQNECVASISGSGNIIAAVSQNLDAFITGSGNIYFLGDPEITSHITGSGKVLPY